MRRERYRAASLAAVAMLASAACAEQLNVSRIVTGTQTAVDWTELNKISASVGTLSHFDLGTVSNGSGATVVYDPPPWTAALSAAPTQPKVSRVTTLKDYTDNGAQVTYDQHYTGSASVDMTPASPTPKPVISRAFKSGGASASVSYRVKVVVTSAKPLDYFVALAIPQQKRGVSPAYDLCCSGDSNGGTYSYRKPNSASARAAVDLYVDDLPVWSSESAYIYPKLAGGDAFDALEVTWDKSTAPGATTLFLGRFASGAAFVVTLVVRTEAHGDGACGTQSYGFPGPTSYAKHCLDLAQTVTLTGAAGQPAGFTVFTKSPKP